MWVEEAFSKPTFATKYLKYRSGRFQIPVRRVGGCIEHVIQPRLVTSADEPRYRCSVPQRTQRSAFQISFYPDWQIDNVFLILRGPSWRVLKSGYTGGGPEQGFRRCLGRLELNQS